MSVTTRTTNQPTAVMRGWRAVQPATRATTPRAAGAVADEPIRYQLTSRVRV
jgi:hypothetical protein